MGIGILIYCKSLITPEKHQLSECIENEETITDIRWSCRNTMAYLDRTKPMQSALMFLCTDILFLFSRFSFIRFYLYLILYAAFVSFYHCFYRYKIHLYMFIDIHFRQGENKNDNYNSMYRSNLTVI
jgi:hypothetical protein